MARVTYGALITELAGSIGGITFQKNSSGNVARLKSNLPVNATGLQQDQQIKLSQIMPAWSALSVAQKTGWNNFALAHPHVNQWNETKQLNGFQWFASCNINLLLTGQAMISSAPAWTALSAVPAFSLSADATKLQASFGVGVDFTGYRLLVYSTPPLKQSTLKLRKPTTFLASRDETILASFWVSTYFAAAFNLSWPTVFAGSSCNFIVRLRKVQEATGLSSPYTSAIIKIN